MPSLLIAAVSRHVHHDAGSISDDPDRLLDLADVLDALTDPRRRQGRRYRLAPILARCTIAVLAGATTLAAIERRAAYLPDEFRHRLGLRAAPRVTTLGRLLARVDGDAVDAAVGRGSRHTAAALTRTKDCAQSPSTARACAARAPRRPGRCTCCRPSPTANACAFVVPERKAVPAFDESAARAELRRSLPPHLLPAIVRAVAAFWETASGKTDRNALPNPFDESQRPRHADAPRSAAGAAWAALPEAEPAPGTHTPVSGTPVPGGDSAPRPRCDRDDGRDLGPCSAV
ncbi:transposase family protein [Streptomyces sp. I6]|uniref:transposase family protein n=1 Tax=Streptomyces sp. I6 TaxID=2483113 RepID=UPI000F45EDC3|nr:hypothetical protein EBF04_29575 [Streptomyces sp. I6]